MYDFFHATLAFSYFLGGASDVS